MKVAVVLGTRPEIIKMCPVIRELNRREVQSFVIHTGQHYSYQMDKIFFEDLDLTPPEHMLNVGERFSQPGAQTGEMIKLIEGILSREKPDVVLVEGDTNSVLSGGIAGVKSGVKVGHVEAGLRSFDRNMPEEINRILVDHLSDYLFAPTPVAEQNLLNEGIVKDRIFVTGNTIVDAVYQNLEIAEKKSRILSELSLREREYLLITLHRQENVDNPERLKNVLEVLSKMEYTCIFPIHPRTEKRMKEFGYTLNNPNVRVMQPMGYLDFLKLLSSARIVLTDSGGIQEETNILHVPCLTLRDNTERPETVEAGSNIVVGVKPENVQRYVDKILGDRELETMMRNAPVVFGDGKAAERIIRIVVCSGIS